MNTTQITAFLAYFILILGRIIVYAIIARIILSWLKVGGHASIHSRFSQILNEVTEPFINIARKLPHRAGMFDFAPLIAIIGIDLIVELTSKFLLNFA